MEYLNYTNQELAELSNKDRIAYYKSKDYFRNKKIPNFKTEQPVVNYSIYFAVSDEQYIRQTFQNAVIPSTCYGNRKTMYQLYAASCLQQCQEVPNIQWFDYIREVDVPDRLYLSEWSGFSHIKQFRDLTFEQRKTLFELLQLVNKICSFTATEYFDAVQAIQKTRILTAEEVRLLKRYYFEPDFFSNSRDYYEPKTGKPTSASHNFGRAQRVFHTGNNITAINQVVGGYGVNKISHLLSGLSNQRIASLSNKVYSANHQKFYSAVTKRES